MKTHNDNNEDTSKTDATYMQFYNAVGRKHSNKQKIADKTYESVSYADAMPICYVDPGRERIEVMAKDASNKDISIYKEYRFKKRLTIFFVLHGDFAEPKFSISTIPRTELDKLNEVAKTVNAALIANTAVHAQAFDAYVSKVDPNLCRCRDVRQCGLR